MTDPRSRIPSIDRLLAEPAAEPLRSEHGHERLVRALREAVEEVRGEIRDGRDPGDVAGPAGYLERAGAILIADQVPSLRRVLNATGVVLHTNLGRAPLAPEAIEAMTRVAAGYSNLELDLTRGTRGSRYVHCVSLLTELTGAEDALVVNNAAAALVLALNTVARGRGVLVSRGELVEIGGGFRIPEILDRSGARLMEVGSTNRTRIADYRHALQGGEPRAVLKVHRSNFRMTGFTEETHVDALAELCRRDGVPLVYDLGAGLMVDGERLGLPPEPTPRSAVAAGADLVVFSGDKLLGGPQAGVVAGRETLVRAMRRNPLCRALRLDKVTLAGLEATLRLYRHERLALERIPVLRMLAVDSGVLERRARRLAGRANDAGVACTVVETTGAVGGGTYPGVALPSWGVCPAAPDGAQKLARRLRSADPPVIGRLLDDRLLLDVRTLAEAEEDTLLERLVDACVRAAPGR